MALGEGPSIAQSLQEVLASTRNHHVAVLVHQPQPLATFNELASHKTPLHLVADNDGRRVVARAHVEAMGCCHDPVSCLANLLRGGRCGCWRWLWSRGWRRLRSRGWRWLGASESR